MNALVIPSIREKNLFEFLDYWGELPFKIFVVEDNPTKTFNINGLNHYSWKEIDEILGKDSWIISHRDSAIRSFGFLMAYQAGAEYIFTLDDYCAPIHLFDFEEQHLSAINNHSQWTESYHGKRTRGIPYRNKGSITNIVLNVGLWTGHPDLDSVQTLNGDSEKWQHQIHPTKIIPYGQYFPMCGMNMCFKREATPLMYFPLMGEGYPYKRFDDIWCGIIAKKICDHLGYLITCGPPYINHQKASDPFINLVKEAPGIAANEKFWENIDSIKLTLDNFTDCMCEIGIGLQANQDEYLKKLGNAILVWSHLFQSME